MTAEETYYCAVCDQRSRGTECFNQCHACFGCGADLLRPESPPWRWCNCPPRYRGRLFATVRQRVRRRATERKIRLERFERKPLERRPRLGDRVKQWKKIRGQRQRPRGQMRFRRWLGPTLWDRQARPAKPWFRFCVGE
jgi:hypothetical protein